MTPTLATPASASSIASPQAQPTEDVQPWWKHGHVWMIIGGPAIVVVASFATLVLAIRTPDPVVASDYYRRGLEINKTLTAGENALAPAMQARNHAATPTAPAAANAAAGAGKAMEPADR